MAAPGVHVLIAGGGLAGLTAGYELSQRGVRVTIVEARQRLGGRVYTLRDADGLPVEAGGELIDEPHEDVRDVARTLRVPLVRVLRGGFGLALQTGGRTRVYPSVDAPWRDVCRRVAPYVDAYTRAGASWDTATAAAIARRSVSDLVPPGTRPASTRAFLDGLRGLFLAEPEDLSALVLVDLAHGGEAPGRVPAYRVRGGADRLIDALARRLRGEIRLGVVLRRLAQDRGGVTATIEHGGHRHELRADYAIVTLPPPLALACHCDPRLPARQRTALAALAMGAATKVSVRFDRPWWRRRGRPRAFGSNLPVGAMWETAEDRRAAVLTFLGGASASATLADATRDPERLVEPLRVLGEPRPGRIVGQAVTWEDEPWSLGGYAVFGPGVDPRERGAIGATHGRLAFAGEHTSAQWQGFLNGAVESGRRAAAEIDALSRLARLDSR